MTTRFSQYKFYLEEHPTCCGMFVVGNIERGITYNPWIAPTLFKTEKEACLDFEKEMVFNLIENVGVRESNHPTGGILLELSLVSRYNFSGLDVGRMSQAPELAKYLVKSGWEIKNVFINTNTGNEVTLYTRFVTPEELEAYKNWYSEDQDE